MKRSRLFIIIALLIAVILFGTAALCNQCGITPTTETKAAATEESKTSETIAGGTTTQETATETTVKETTTETTMKETTTKEETTTATTESEAPTISLKIYEGPTYSAPDDVCYYRVEAVVTGIPKPVVKFSRDDSNGAWGSKKVQINLTKTNPTYTLTAVAINSAGEATASITLNWGCGPLVVEKTIDLHPSISGTVGPAGFVTTTFVAIGDSPVNSDWRARFAFDVSSLAGKEIVNAKLKLANPVLSPNPCNFKGNIVIFYNDFLPDLTASDYFSPAYAGPQIFPWNAEPLEFSTDFLKTKIAERASAHVELQFGMGYENTASNMNGIAEGRVYYADNITLTVTYKE
jgi:hypothetical protein